MEGRDVTRYMVQPRWIHVMAVVLLAAMGLAALYQGAGHLLGPTPDRGETREPTAGERIDGTIVIGMACVLWWGVPWFLRRPYAVHVHKDGTIVLVRLWGRTTLVAAGIDAIEAKRDEYIIRISHGTRTTSMSYFEAVGAFVVDVRWLNPDVVVTGTGQPLPPHAPLRGGHEDEPPAR